MTIVTQLRAIMIDLQERSTDVLFVDYFWIQDLSINGLGSQIERESMHLH